MSKKVLYLFLALLLPGLIFIFLKRFGKNEFDIPLYYQQHVDSLNSICGTTYTEPFRLPDSVLRKINWKDLKASLLVFEFAGESKKELDRLSDSFAASEYRMIRINRTQWGETVYRRWTSCVFFVSPPWNVVLMDHRKQIRGYYSIGSREETDRLILEMKILLKKY